MVHGDCKQGSRVCVKTRLVETVRICCSVREIIVTPPSKIFPPPFTFSPKSGLATCSMFLHHNQYYLCMCIMFKDIKKL